MAEVNRSEAETKAEENRLRLIRIDSKKMLNGRNLRRSDWYCGRRSCIDVDRTGIVVGLVLWSPFGG